MKSDWDKDARIRALEDANARLMFERNQYRDRLLKMKARLEDLQNRTGVQ